MASLYTRENGVYYLSISFQGKRIIRSLGTRSKSIAMELIPDIERAIYCELLQGRKKRETPFKQLAKLYLATNHNWKPSTFEIYNRMLDNYIKRGFPENKTTRAMMIRVVNSCNNWGLKQGYIQSFMKLEGGSNFEARTRILTDKELELVFENVTPYYFNQFVQFAYYTGARSGEIRRISRVKLFSDYMIVEGKSGRRAVRLASQARKILDENPQWNYSKDYVIKAWSRNRKRLGLQDTRMHDLRRTFGCG